MAGIKDIETRSWAPPRSLIGEWIAIHAASRRGRSSNEPHVLFHEQAMEALRNAGAVGEDCVFTSELPRGAILGTVKLVKAWQVECLIDQTDPELPPGDVAESYDGKTVMVDDWGDFSVGRWLWFLADPMPIDPITAPGFQRVCPDPEPSERHDEHP